MIVRKAMQSVALCALSLALGWAVPLIAQDIGGQVNNPPVQGSGGGFDADMVDGHHASDFALLGASNSFTGVNTFPAATVTGNVNAGVVTASQKFIGPNGPPGPQAFLDVIPGSGRIGAWDNTLQSVLPMQIFAAALSIDSGAGAVDMTPANGTFSGTISDGVNSASGVFTFYKIGGLVSIVAQSAVAFVGTGTALSMTGFPAALRPSSPAYFMCPQVGGDGSTSYVGACRVHAAAEGVSQIDMGISVVSGATAALTVPNGGSSPSGQHKGVAAGWSITYTAN